MTWLNRMFAALAERIRTREEEDVYRLFREVAVMAWAYKCRVINVTTELYELLDRRRLRQNDLLCIPIEDDSLPLAFKKLPIVSGCERLEFVF